MNETIIKTIEILENINKKNELGINSKDFDEEKCDLLTNQDATNHFETTELILKKSLEKQSIDDWVKGICNLSLLLDAFRSDLWNTEQLILKIIRKTPITQALKKHIVKPEFNFSKNIQCLINQDLIEKRKINEGSSSYKNIYQLNKTFSPLLRKNDYLIQEDGCYKLYDETRYYFKLAYNTNGSCNFIKTKMILDKLLLENEKFFG